MASLSRFPQVFHKSHTGFVEIPVTENGPIVENPVTGFP
jgi:hypothetical protein